MSYFGYRGSSIPEVNVRTSSRANLRSYLTPKTGVHKAFVPFLTFWVHFSVRFTYQIVFWTGGDFEGFFQNKAWFSGQVCQKRGLRFGLNYLKYGHFLPVPIRLRGVLGEKRPKWPKKGGPKRPILGVLGLGARRGLFGERLEKGVSYRGTFVNGQSCSKLTGKRSQKQFLTILAELLP